MSKVPIGNIKGKSAFQQAVQGGYAGTEADFNTLLAQAVSETIEFAEVVDGDLIVTKLNGSTVNLGRVQGADGSNVIPTNEAIAQAVTEDGPAKDALSATFVGAGRSVTEFGVSSSASGSANVAAMQAAVDWAGDNAFGARTLIVPALGAGDYYDMAGTVIISAPDVEIVGFGEPSRFRQNTKPAHIFRVKAARAHIHYLGLYGIDRDVTGYTAWVRDTREAQLYAGVVCQYGADGSVVENIVGADLTSVVHVNAYDDTAGDYVANIQGLTIRNLIVDDVWTGCHVREVDDLLIENVRGTYSNAVGYTANPHLVYVAFIDTEALPFRPLLRSKIRNCTAVNGTGGAAYALKAIQGGDVKGMTHVGCPGLFDLDEMTDTNITGSIAMSDVRAGDGSIFARDCTRVFIDAPQISMATGDYAGAVMIHDSCVDVTVRDPKVTMNRATATTAESAAPVYIQGTRTRLLSPSVKNLGASSGTGIRFVNATDCVLYEPVVSGFRRTISIQPSAAGVRLEYRDGDLTPSAVTGAQRVEVASGATFAVSPRTVGDSRVVVQDDGDFGSGSTSIWNRASSGQVVETLTGTATIDTDKRIKFANNSHACAVIDSGRANVRITAEIQYAGGSGAGVQFRTVDAGNAMFAELRSTGLHLAYRTAAGSVTAIGGGYAFTPVSGRRYEMEVIAHGANVVVLLDGVERINETVPSPPHDTLGTATKHGFRANGSASERFTALRIMPS